MECNSERRDDCERTSMQLIHCSYGLLHSTCLSASLQSFLHTFACGMSLKWCIEWVCIITTYTVATCQSCVHKTLAYIFDRKCIQKVTACHMHREALASLESGMSSWPLKSAPWPVMKFQHHLEALVQHVWISSSNMLSACACINTQTVWRDVKSNISGYIKCILYAIVL